MSKAPLTINYVYELAQTMQLTLLGFFFLLSLFCFLVPVIEPRSLHMIISHNWLHKNHFMASDFIFIFNQQIWGNEYARLIAAKHCRHKEILILRMIFLLHSNFINIVGMKSSETGSAFENP